MSCRSRRFPISVMRIGRRFMLFCAIADTRHLKRRILFKAFLSICLKKIR